MARSTSESDFIVSDARVTAADFARMRNGSALPRPRSATRRIVPETVAMKASSRHYREAHDALAKKVFAFGAALVVLVFFSLCVMGAMGQYYPYSEGYALYNPEQVARAIYYHGYNAVAQATHVFEPRTNAWLLENVPGYWAIAERAGVVAVTLICAVLLAVSGMLYQNVFKNPIAGPGMLGVSSGVSLGMMLIVALYASAAPAMIQQRYVFCYGLGAAILVFVIAAGKRLSGPGASFDIVTMLLIGSIVSQLLGFIVSYVTLFVMDEESYAVFYTMSQMLVVDTSLVSWVALGIASVVSFVPVLLYRYRFTALAFDDREVRLLGFDPVRLRSIALVCGAIMILAAQIHVGMVSLVSLVVPYLSRIVFGCEFNKQLIGNVCIGTVLLLFCRDICDLLPFVGDGLAVGSVVSVVALPLFIVVMARQMKGWS